MRFVNDERVLSFLSEMLGKLESFFFFFFRLSLRIRNMHKFRMKREGVSPQDRLTAQNPRGQQELDQTHTLGNRDINLSGLRV